MVRSNFTMTTATLEKKKKKKKHLREKRGPLEIFHGLNTTHLTTLGELNKQRTSFKENEAELSQKLLNQFSFTFRVERVCFS